MSFSENYQILNGISISKNDLQKKGRKNGQNNEIEKHKWEVVSFSVPPATSNSAAQKVGSLLGMMGN